MKIPRTLEETVAERLMTTKQAVIIYGPRQSGKTTLANDVIAGLGLRTLSINGDDLSYADVLSSRDSRRLAELVSGYELLFVDEAQRIPEIGINLKIIIDGNPGLKVMATGSSSFELASSVSEPLTGRKWTFRLYPIAVLELGRVFNRFELREQIEERLVYGSYPNLFNLAGRDLKIAYLRELASDYLYKDILQLDKVRDSARIRDLLRLLAFQVGSQVSLSELGTQLGMNKETVGRYLDLLEKTFVIFRLGGFSRNLRKEVTKSPKYYFYDVGIRNAVIDNFRMLSDRDDAGRLWENFVISERVKRNHYRAEDCGSYFWRTYTGAEIDYVEERGGVLQGYEIKSGGASAPRAPRTWLDEYAGSTWQVVDRENWLDFVI